MPNPTTTPVATTVRWAVTRASRAPFLQPTWCTTTWLVPSARASWAVKTCQGPSLLVRYTFNFSFALDAGWNTNEMYIIGMLIEDNGSVNNGGRAAYDEAIAADFVAGEVIVGVENLLGPDDLRVFPNPAVDQLTVQFAQPGTQPVQVRNLQGQVVLRQDVRSGHSWTFRYWHQACT